MANLAPPRHLQPLTELDEAWRQPTAGGRLQSVRRAAGRLRDRLLESGRVVSLRTFDIGAFPYPTRFGLGGAARSTLPWLLLVHRMQIVQFETSEGLKTLLFNPTDYERVVETPFFQGLRRRWGIVFERLSGMHRPKPADHLAQVGLAPEDIDYLAFDHLHTQDLREMLGTTAPALGRQTPLSALYPRARLLVWRTELVQLDTLHPLQRQWYQPDCLRDVPSGRIIACDGDFLMGRGAALVRTPGHTAGNWSLLVNTDSGVWAVSENGIVCDAYAPAASSIPGLRRHARETGEEVILNSNTLEQRNDQYTSMILEKTLCDRCRDNPEFFQHFASSELTSSPLAPRLGPTYSHGAFSSGTVRRSVRPTVAPEAPPDPATCGPAVPPPRAPAP
jgi:hypothetical protein